MFKGDATVAGGRRKPRAGSGLKAETDEAIFGRVVVSREPRHVCYVWPEFSERSRLRKTATKLAEFSSRNRSTHIYFIKV